MPRLLGGPGHGLAAKLVGEDVALGLTPVRNSIASGHEMISQCGMRSVGSRRKALSARSRPIEFALLPLDPSWFDYGPKVGSLRRDLSTDDGEIGGLPLERSSGLYTGSVELSPLLASHRSIRKYKPDPIDRGLIEKVCHEAIIGASSSGNLNCVSIVLTRDLERRQRLFELHSEQEMILQAPLALTFCADWWRTREWLRQRGARDNFNNFLGYHVGAFDAMILAQNVCLGFENEGLGICYMGTTLFQLREIGELLGLPETCIPVTTIVAGYPDESPAKRDRLPLNAFLHDETYRMPTPAEIDEVYAEREVRGWERYMSFPELAEMAKEKGITSLAQFYTSEIKYSPEFFAACSEDIRKVLEEKGFLK